MDVNYIAYATPVFLALMGIELLVAYWQGQQYYRFNDAITDISCGIGQQVVGVFLKSLLFAGYGYFYERYALLDLATNPLAAWMVAFFGVDVAYYWWHRLSHRVNFMWAIHIVHHQSEDYNLAVALRQAWFSGVTSSVFYLPIAFLGVPPLVFLTMVSFSTLYQFWIHTRTIGKIGPLEWVINTPSHHRVHHGRNPKYLDKNYGATLISWDRLFGTFQEEEEEPVYGTVTAYASWNPIWANFDYWADLARDARQAPRWTDKLKIWFMYPGWRPRGLTPHPAPPEVKPEEAIRYDTETPRGLNGYIAVHYALVVMALVWFLLKADAVSLIERAAAAGLMLLTMLIWGGLFEKKTWALPLELARLVVLAVVTVAYFWDKPSMLPIVAVTLVVLGTLARWVLRYRSLFIPARQEVMPA